MEVVKGTERCQTCVEPRNLCVSCSQTCNKGRKDIVEALVMAGANMDLTTNAGNTALMLVSFKASHAVLLKIYTLQLLALKFCSS